MADTTYSATARAASRGVDLLVDFDFYRKYYKEYYYDSITEKQAGAIYRLYKSDKLSLTKEGIDLVYEFASPARSLTTDSDAHGVAGALNAAVNAAFDRNYTAVDAALYGAAESYVFSYAPERKISDFTKWTLDKVSDEERKKANAYYE